MALKKWIAEYEVDGSKYALTFDTYDFEDPEARVEGMRNSLVLLGEMGGIVPADEDGNPTSEPLDFDYPD